LITFKMVEERRHTLSSSVMALQVEVVNHVENLYFIESSL
jgi:hypothetical protein